MAAAALVATAEPDELVAKLWKAIEPDLLTMLGWDFERKVLTFPPDHPLLGWRVCVVNGCTNDGRLGNRLCVTCQRRWKRAGDTSLEEFLSIPKPVQRCIGVRQCAVEECQRPWKSARKKLCTTHEYQQRYTLQLPLEEFVTHPDVVPLPSFGPCKVAACTRDRVGRGRYCHQHGQRFKQAKRDLHFDVDRWERTSSAVAETQEVSLRGLPPLVVAEVIYGLQQRTKADIKTRHVGLRPLCDLLRSCEVASVTELPEGLGSRGTQVLAKSIAKAVRRQGLTPETERHKDVWDLHVFGHAGYLTFTEISQPWLREALKAWAYGDLSTRRGNHVTNVVQQKINSMARLSESLRSQRDDCGEIVTALSRQDITAFCNRMAYLQEQGTISGHLRLNQCRSVRLVLNRSRAMGLTQKGRPLHGLPDDFAMGPEDIPDEPEDTEAGRDLPSEVMRHLTSHLDMLEAASGKDIRFAVEMMIDTGRRLDEVCKLPLDCLDRDQDGKPVLIYDNHKNNRTGRRLPIPAATAGLIVEQQERVRARFPGTPDNELKIVPGKTRNPMGRRSMTDDWVGDRHRAWILGLPDVNVPTVVEVDGKAVTKLLPFDKSRMTPHAYRHTYAQRHADAGVDVTVLKELMDHRQLSTTQLYYQVGAERRREAVERVTTMQFDRHGNRVWRDAKAMLDSEHHRRAVGEVAVPYGGCSEPSNVAAGGHDCPLRFRCIGCGHFSTDISYLPDLERYLADLLRHREKLVATMDADEWARNEALPSDEEIKRIRRLINRMKTDLDDLTDDERAEIDDAIAVVRRGRSKVVGLGMPRIRQPIPDVRPERSA